MDQIEEVKAAEYFWGVVSFCGGILGFLLGDSAGADFEYIFLREILVEYRKIHVFWGAYNYSIPIVIIVFHGGDFLLSQEGFSILFLVGIGRLFSEIGVIKCGIFTSTKRDSPRWKVQSWGLREVIFGSLYWFVIVVDCWESRSRINGTVNLRRSQLRNNVRTPYELCNGVVTILTLPLP